MILTNEKLKKHKMDLAFLGICILFYLLFPLIDGAVWCVDSNGYATMNITREPVYPIFLALCKKIAGGGYCELAVVLQSLLAAFATWYAGVVVKKIKNNSLILQLGTVCFQFAVTLLCRFVAGRGSAYTDSILTEGLGLSLFVLFIVQLFLAVWKEKHSDMLWTFVLAFLLISLRKQMLIVLPTMCIVFFWYVAVKRHKWKKFILLFLLCCCVLITGKIFDKAYNYAVRGAWIEHSGNSMGILCTLLYTSNPEEDRNLFTDEKIKELYLQIISEAEEQQLVYTKAPNEGSRWIALTTHFADSYDAIGYGIINPVVEGYLAEKGVVDEVERALQYDEICGAMTTTLFRQEKKALLELYLYNTWKGFVNTIAVCSIPFSIYAACAYLGLFILAAYLIRQITGKKYQMEEALMNQIKASLCFTFIIMTGISINAMVVGLMIFAQSRYMIYGMGLFYTAYSMMLYDFIKIKLFLSKQGCYL